MTQITLISQMAADYFFAYADDLVDPTSASKSALIREISAICVKKVETRKE